MKDRIYPEIELKEDEIATVEWRGFDRKVTIEKKDVNDKQDVGESK